MRVADVDDDDSGDCSDEFYLMAHAEAPSAGDAGGPYVTVTSPSSGDSAEAGEEYTVEVSIIEGTRGGKYASLVCSAGSVDEVLGWMDGAAIGLYRWTAKALLRETECREIIVTLV